MGFNSSVIEVDVVNQEVRWLSIQAMNDNNRN